MKLLQSLSLFFTLWRNAHMNYLSVPVLYWSDALYNSVLGKALAESTWNYHIVRLAGNPAE